MNRVLVSVEGQTEETFVKEVLSRYLWDFNLEITPRLISTKKMKQGSEFKGGLRTYYHAKQQILLLLGDSNVVAVTSMYDFYRIPKNFPGYTSMPAKDCYARVRHLETEFQKDITDPRFKPYLQLHEFETFLFVSPAITARELFSGKDHTRSIQRIRDTFASPEEINEGEETAPSKRIKRLYPAYNKEFYGTIVAGELGIDMLKTECPHFCEWVKWLESLGN